MLPRSSILFFVGLGVIINEVGGWQQRPPNPAALLAGLAMCGIPALEGTEGVLRRALMDSMSDDKDDKDRESASS